MKNENPLRSIVRFNKAKEVEGAGIAQETEATTRQLLHKKIELTQMII